MQRSLDDDSDNAGRNVQRARGHFGRATEVVHGVICYLIIAFADRSANIYRYLPASECKRAGPL
jgi:hypothetical protein